MHKGGLFDKEMSKWDENNNQKPKKKKPLKRTV